MSFPGVEQWIRKGDLRRAASSLVVSYGPDVLATCIAMLRDRTAAEDVTQEVFSDALRALSTFRGDSSPRTWLLSIARNRCIDYLRARKRDPWGGTLDENASEPDAHADQGAFGTEWFVDRSLVLRALGALADGDRALIVLRYKNGLEYDELATAFGLREGTVRMRVSRALARMRRVLESEEKSLLGAPLAGSLPAQMPRSEVPPPAAAAPTRARAALPSTSAPLPPAPGAVAARRGAYGAPPPPAPLSWWARLKVWAGLGQHEVGRPTPPNSAPRALASPVGTLGAALAQYEPAALSESLTARLGSMIESLPGD